MLQQIANNHFCAHLVQPFRAVIFSVGPPAPHVLAPQVLEAAMNQPRRFHHIREAGALLLGREGWIRGLLGGALRSPTVVARRLVDTPASAHFDGQEPFRRL